MRLTDAEKNVIAAAAGRVGMTPTGYVAETALAAARASRPAGLEPRHEELAQVQAELFGVRSEVQQIGANLNQAIAAFRATGSAPVWLERVAQRCQQSLDAVDATITRADAQLR